MREMTKEAVETLYHNSLKPKLQQSFEAVMSEVKALPDGIYGQYATNSLKNLIQLSAKGIADINVLLTEYLNTSDTLYANYEESFSEIRRLEAEAMSQKRERDRLYADFKRKEAAYLSLKGGDENGTQSN